MEVIQLLICTFLSGMVQALALLIFTNSVKQPEPGHNDRYTNSSRYIALTVFATIMSGTSLLLIVFFYRLLFS